MNGSDTPDQWQTLQFSAPKNLTELISDFLMDLGAVSVGLEDAKSQALFETRPNQQLLWDTVTIMAYFDSTIDLDVICEQIRSVTNNQQLVIEKTTFADEDWIAKVKSHFKPQQYGKLWVYPSWETPKTSNEMAICIDPGQAFGTGSHQTTSLCLDWLAKQNLADKTLLDFGCGTGILGIAAKRLGCSHVDFVDNDPQALAVALENGQRNQLDVNHAIFLPEQLPKLQYDIVVANILAQTLIKLADQLIEHVKAGGNLILSGILANQVDSIDQAFLPHCSTRDIIQKDEWILWVGVKF